VAANNARMLLKSWLRHRPAADAVNLLCLAVLNFQFQFVRDVALDGNVVRDGAFLVANGAITASSVNSVSSFFLLMKRRATLAGADFGPQLPIKGAVLSVALEQPRIWPMTSARL